MCGQAWCPEPWNGKWADLIGLSGVGLFYILWVFSLIWQDYDMNFLTIWKHWIGDFFSVPLIGETENAEYFYIPRPWTSKGQGMSVSTNYSI